MLLPQKKTLVVTDSGLGGLSVFSFLFNHLLEWESRPSQVGYRLVFFDAFPESLQGYNQMPDTRQRALAFDQILERIEARYNPASVVIACNTLSAVYPDTQHSQGSREAFGILPCGLELMKSFRQENPLCPVVIVATSVTIASGAYRTSDPRLFSVSGGDLATLIEEPGSKDAAISRILERIFEEIRAVPGLKEEIALFLGCTHYGFLREDFRRVARSFGFSKVHFLDPNRHLAEEVGLHLRRLAPGDSPPCSGDDLEIGHLTGIEPDQLEAIARRIEDPSGLVKKTVLEYASNRKGRLPDGSKPRNRI